MNPQGAASDRPVSEEPALPVDAVRERPEGAYVPNDSSRWKRMLEHFGFLGSDWEESELQEALTDAAVAFFDDYGRVCEFERAPDAILLRRLFLQFLYHARSVDDERAATEWACKHPRAAERIANAVLRALNPLERNAAGRAYDPEHWRITFEENAPRSSRDYGFFYALLAMDDQDRDRDAAGRMSVAERAAREMEVVMGADAERCCGPCEEEAPPPKVIEPASPPTSERESRPDDSILGGAAADESVRA